jgi:hypothetical protein
MAASFHAGHSPPLRIFSIGSCQFVVSIIIIALAPEYISSFVPLVGAWLRKQALAL